MMIPNEPTLNNVPPRSARDIPIVGVSFSSEKDKDPQLFSDTLAFLGEQPEVRAIKHGCTCYSLVTYAAGAKRCKEGVVAVHALVLDYDHVTEAQAAQVRARIEPYAFVAYSTFRHQENGTDDHRFRVVIPFQRHVTPNELHHIRDVLVDDIGVDPDPAATDASRIWFMPCCPPERQSSAFIVYSANTTMLDPAACLSRPRPLQRPTARPSPLVPNQNATMQFKVGMLDGAGEGERNVTLASLIGHLLRRGVDPHVARELSFSWNATHNQPPLSDLEVEAVIESIASRELRRRKGVHRG